MKILLAMASNPLGMTSNLIAIESKKEKAKKILLSLQDIINLMLHFWWDG